MTGHPRLAPAEPLENAREALQSQIDRLRVHPFLVGQPLLELQTSARPVEYAADVL